MVTESTINRVNSLPIADVVGHYVKLAKKGKDYVGCCPFHEDNTPSFHVSPAMEIYKCFSCGKGGRGAISFVMEHEHLSYPLAVKKICEDHHIDFEEEKCYDVKQEEKSKQKEAMYANFRLVQDFYVEQLASNPQAQEYAYRRWGKDLCEEFGIGFAPYGNMLLGYARNRISESLLADMGMTAVKEGAQQPYDCFRNRIMIPICDSYGRTVAFTARTLLTDAERKKNPDSIVQKYINNKNTPIYSKSDVIFNLDKAKRNLGKHPVFFAVEGAPDALTLYRIGVRSTIATLGRQWNEAQLKQLSRFCKDICFIPDADIPKEDEETPGMSGVIESAKLAIKMGFSCRIREIPLGADGSKNDADSYCRTREIFDSLQEQDFIEWFAARTFKGKSTPQEKAEAFHTVAEVIGTVEDEVLRKQYTDQMALLYDNADLWEKKVREGAESARLERERMGSRPEVDTMKLYEFGIDRKGFYYSMTEKGGIRRWSNFVMTPLWHIRDDMRTVRIFRLTNTDHVTQLVELKQSDLVSIAQFKLRTEIIGNFIWRGKEDDLTKLKEYLYSFTETAFPIRRMGWQKQYGFYAFGNGLVYGGKFIKADEQGIVRLEDMGNFYFPAASEVWRNEECVYVYERNFFHRDLSAFSLNEYVSLVVKVFGNNGMVAITYLFAAIFRDIIVARTEKFPVLNIFGQKSSGKTELAMSLMAFFINNTKPDNLNSTSVSAAGRIVAQCCSAMVHFDEYKNSLNPKFIDFFKGLWDGTGRTLSIKDDDKKSESTAVDTAVVITGQEMPTVDVALFTRLVYLSNSRTSFTNEEKANMERLKDVRSTGCSHLTVQLLSYRKVVEKDFRKAYDSVASDMQASLRGQCITDRIFFNWRVILAIDRVLNPVLNLPYSSEDLYKVCIEGMKNQEALVSSNDEVAGFWNVIQFMFNQDIIFLDGDFRIDMLTSIKCDGFTKREFNGAMKVLRLRYKTAIPLYFQHCRSVNQEALPESSLIHYLTTGAGYIGKQRSVRFKKLSPSGYEMPASVNGTVLPGPNAIVTTPDQAYCFDYCMLQELYGLSIEANNETRATYASNGREDENDNDNDE